MTTPPPYSDHFSVSPEPMAGPGIDISRLPPMPPQPRELKLGLRLTGLAVLIFLIGNVWETITLVSALGNPPRPEEVERVANWAFSPLVYGAIVAVLAWFTWRGYRVALWLFVIGAAVAVLRPLVVVWWLVAALISEQSAEFVADTLTRPGPIGQGLAATFSVPVLILLTRRPVWRWSRKADAIRVFRGLVKRGAPVHRVPPHIYD